MKAASGQDTTASGRILLAAVAVLAVIAGLFAWMLAADEYQELSALSARTRAAWLSAMECMRRRNAVVRLSAKMLAKRPDAPMRLLTQMRQDLRRGEATMREDLLTQDQVTAEKELSVTVGRLLEDLSARGDKFASLEKLADLLAAAQNRLALHKNRYARHAAAQRAAMQTPQGSAVSCIVGMPKAIPYE